MTDKLNRPARIAVYGAQFGSEGKACVAEHIIKTRLGGRAVMNEHGVTTRHGYTKPVILGENAPNSGHTCSEGKTRNIPASSYFGQCVFIGPDAVIDPDVLCADVRQVLEKNPELVVWIHEHAARCSVQNIRNERDIALEARVASTITGGGSARSEKQLVRNIHLTIGADTTWIPGDLAAHVIIVRRQNWLTELMMHADLPWIYEGSQGLMLDVNLGYYPFVTSRTTHPMAALARNGFLVGCQGENDPAWRMVGTFRTFPIRTGGNSGPTGGQELQWGGSDSGGMLYGIQPEIATVTHRTRRVFEFSAVDFWYSVSVNRPHEIFFTHVDYLGLAAHSERDQERFRGWLSGKLFLSGMPNGWLSQVPLSISSSPSFFAELGTLAESIAERYPRFDSSVVIDDPSDHQAV